MELAGKRLKVKKFGTIIGVSIIVFAWMGLIIFFSQENGVESTQRTGVYLNALSHIIPLDTPEQIWWATAIGRKLAHVIIYMVLGMLGYGAVKYVIAKKRWKISPLTMTLILGIVFAIADEIHQTFIPGRQGKVSDVLIDTAGVVIGLALIYFFEKKLKKSR